jgi:tRNA (cytidine/uridine-2'-O-)-methyltransferase
MDGTETRWVAGPPLPTDPPPSLHIVLYHPEIPQNTGNIGRLCLGIGAVLHVVHPISFQMDEKAVRRAGLDYWRHVRLIEHPDEAHFWSWAEGRRTYLLSSHGDRPYTQATWRRGDVIVLGQETVGLPRALVEARGALTIPMGGPTRSLNVANAAAVVAYHAMISIEPSWF